MRAARMHGYDRPLVLDDVPVPDIRSDEALVHVKAAGMCRTDVQLIDGYFRPYAEFSFPITPGHEIAGEISKIGSDVPDGEAAATAPAARHMRTHHPASPKWPPHSTPVCSTGSGTVCRHGSSRRAHPARSSARPEHQRDRTRISRSFQ